MEGQLLKSDTQMTGMSLPMELPGQISEEADVSDRHVLRVERLQCSRLRFMPITEEVRPDVGVRGGGVFCACVDPCFCFGACMQTTSHYCSNLFSTLNLRASSNRLRLGLLID